MSSLFDYITTINKKSGVKPRDNIMQFEADYHPFMVNKNFSYFLDTVLDAQEMNIRWSPMHNIPPEAHFAYLYNTISKGFRSEKWVKQEKSDEISTICAVYGYSPKQAREVLDLFSEDDIKQLKQKLYEGGTK